jgi:hypothetical protein
MYLERNRSFPEMVSGPYFPFETVRLIGSSDGLACYQNGAVAKYTMQDGLANNTVLSIDQNRENIMGGHNGWLEPVQRWTVPDLYDALVGYLCPLG